MESAEIQVFLEKQASLSDENEATMTSLDESIKGKREVYIPELDEMREVIVYDGDIINGEFIIEGPAVIEQVNTTIFLGQTYNCQTGIAGSFIVFNRDLLPEGIAKNENKVMMQEV